MKNNKVMKKLFRILLKALLGVLILIFLAVTFLVIKYSPRYVYRLARYHVADVYDYTHFENRMIGASGSTFTFPLSKDEPYVESLFREKVEANGFGSLEEWAEKSYTTALIVIRRDTRASPGTTRIWMPS